MKLHRPKCSQCWPRRCHTPWGPWQAGLHLLLDPGTRTWGRRVQMSATCTPSTRGAASGASGRRAQEGGGSLGYDLRPAGLRTGRKWGGCAALRPQLPSPPSAHQRLLGPIVRLPVPPPLTHQREVIAREPRRGPTAQTPHLQEKMVPPQQSYHPNRDGCPAWRTAPRKAGALWAAPQGPANPSTTPLVFPGTDPVLPQRS